ncbi:MAG TPA: tetraacyldisaccharide 4'-kinase [Longimicrobiales bacterium]|nr:tetraacyldisaccharide 4'-kinase [Longimicrobiales bacterium]
MWRGRAGLAGRIASVALLPLSGLYRLVMIGRNLAYGLGIATVHDPDLPVVSVGNLTVGGTGKTPVTRWVVARLRAGGARPSIVMRGYGSDEVDLHRRWAPDVPVVADPDRVAAVTAAAAAGADVAVVDDGFQHRRLGRDLDIVLLAAEEEFPGPVVPRGPYREPARALDRADVLVITRKSADEREADRVERAVRDLGLTRPVVRMHLAPGRIRPLADWGRDTEAAAGAGSEADPAGDGPFRVVSGVADPDSVVAAVRSLGLDVADRADFPDHHAFTAEEIARLRGGPYPLIVTEKDAIKLQAHVPDARDVFVLEQHLRVERGEDILQALLDRVLAGEPT